MRSGDEIARRPARQSGDTARHTETPARRIDEADGRDTAHASGSGFSAERCPPVIDVPDRGRSGGLALAAGIALSLLGTVWLARQGGASATPLLGTVLPGGLLLVGLRRLRIRRAGVSRLAADERGVHFHEVGGGLRSFPWSDCLSMSTVGSRRTPRLRFEFRREDDGNGWKTLRHARVFLRERSVEVITTGMRDAPELLARLESLRATALAGDDGDDARRAAA